APQNQKLLFCGAWCLEPEQRFAFRSSHAILEMGFPDMGPGAAEQVRNLVFDDGARRDRGTAPLDREDRLVAMGVVDRRHVVEVAHPREEADRADRLHKGFGIVEHGLVLEAEELALLVVPWRPDLNGLQRVAVLPTGMG